jgi:hypothetical protein
MTPYFPVAVEALGKLFNAQPPTEETYVFTGPGSVKLP